MLEPRLMTPSRLRKANVGQPYASRSLLPTNRRPFVGFRRSLCQAYSDPLFRGKRRAGQRVGNDFFDFGGGNSGLGRSDLLSLIDFQRGDVIKDVRLDARLRNCDYIRSAQHPGERDCAPRNENSAQFSRAPTLVGATAKTFLPLFELPRVLMCFDHIASRTVNANHSIM